MELDGNSNNVSLCIFNDLSSIGIVREDLEVRLGEVDVTGGIFQGEGHVISKADDVLKLLGLAGSNGLDALDEGTLDQDELLGDRVSDGDVAVLGCLGGLVLAQRECVLEGDCERILELGV